MKRLLTYILLIACAVTAVATPQRTSSRIRMPRSSSSAREIKIPEVKLGDWSTIDYDTIFLEPNMIFVPLVFDQQQGFADSIEAPKLQLHEQTQSGLNAHDYWLQEAIADHQHSSSIRYRAMVDNPQLVPYNVNKLPEPPKSDVVSADPSRSRLTVADHKELKPSETPKNDRVIKLHHWVHNLQMTLQFTQAYISDNWYQGGNNNMNVLSNNVWTINLNQTLHPNYIFNNTIQYKLGLTTAHNDSLRKYSISDDRFQYNAVIGIKAVKRWYYSATVQFYTQLLNNYASNTNNLKAAFLSPGELNVGLGMTYSYTNKAGDRTVNLSIAPASYNMKILRENKKLNPASYGIDAGHHTKSSIGSNFEGKFNWKFNPFITWASRLYTYTNYDYVQGDWENTFDFYVTRHLSTQFYTHLRYDRSRPKDDSWSYWQFKEILSFGLTYRFGR